MQFDLADIDILNANGQLAGTIVSSTLDFPSYP
jgi:hypothetical protein